MAKYFIKITILCFGVLYVLASLSRSLTSPDVQFIKYYTHHYAIGPFTIESAGVHGSGSDLDGYYANVFYRQNRPLPIRFTDLSPQSMMEVTLFLFGIALFLSSSIPFIIWVYLKRPKMSRLPKLSIILLSIGTVFGVISFMPIVSFGRHFVNIFIGG